MGKEMIVGARVDVWVVSGGTRAIVNTGKRITEVIEKTGNVRAYGMEFDRETGRHVGKYSHIQLKAAGPESYGWADGIEG